MTTLLLHNPATADHLTGSGHPERPDRIRAVEAALAAAPFAALVRRLAREATPDEVALAHPLAWVERLIAAAPAAGLAQVDGDTIMSPGTIRAALLGAGAAIAATDAVMGGEVRNAFCATRPPGHHAERTKAMGFCFFNNAAVAARHALRAHGAERVAIVDFDVHHGNGTQDIAWDDPALLYCSTHEMPLYPGTGAARERGAHDNVVNVPLRSGAGREAFEAALGGIVAPRVAAFRPDLLVISAGFDAHRDDPLASLALEEADFAWATRCLTDVADRVCRGRVVSILEGGYDLGALGRSVAAHVEALMAA